MSEQQQGAAAVAAPVTPATLAEAAVLVDAAGQAGVPVLLVGDPGIGKSSMLTALAAARGMHLEIVTASVHDPADFNGMPMIDRDGRFVFEPPAWARRAQAAGVSQVVFDEMNTAPLTVQAALLRVVLEGVVGEITLDRARFVAAMNPVDVAVGGIPLPAPTANRFLHVHVLPDVAEWTSGLLSGWDTTVPVQLATEPDVATQAAVTGQVAAFIAARPDLLSALPADPVAASGPWPSPRSWEHVVKVLPRIGDGAGTSGGGADLSRIRVVEGLVGRAAADAFFTFVEETDLPDPVAVLSGAVVVDWGTERADRVLALLGAFTAAARHDPGLYPPAVGVLEALVGAGREDVAAPAVKALMATRPAGVPVERDLLAKFLPLLQRAGKLS